MIDLKALAWVIGTWILVSGGLALLAVFCVLKPVPGLVTLGIVGGLCFWWGNHEC